MTKEAPIRSSIRSWGSALALSAMMLVLASPASDAQPSTAAANEEAERQQIGAYAESEGLTFDEAYRKLHWQPEFVAYVNELREMRSGELSGAWMDATVEPARAWVAFREQAPEQPPTIEGVEIEVVENRGYSETELVEYAGNLAAHYADAGYTDFVVAPDQVTSRVEVGILRSEAEGDPRASERAQPAPPRGVIVSESAKDQQASLDALYGGGRLEFVNDWRLKCTAGFAVVSGGTRGFATAQHCGAPFTQENTSGSTEYTISSFVNSHRGYYGDFAWYTTSQYESDNFYYMSGYHRDLTGVANPVVGQTLARFGHNTGDQYDDVYKIGVWSHINGVSTGSLVSMKNREAGGGDSGGPWFWTSTAYGIHHGGDSIDGKTRDLFSTVGNMTGTLGVAVATS